MATATKGSSFLSNFISKNMYADASQGSSQTLYQRVQDWGRREHFLRLANVFHTNNY
ncbi:unnamed protein product [Nippostrongylus brasiliensis]|uniref:NADH dehydrogenase [ubiquinone] flavoprotein 3, mitochondrial n=1 Tax=Nippostrongylus brasiliensis TaxID=27835 RepID=A0A158QWK0_NIPBR|nr:unnamed protein product [Nippostrongylus brasiliensis]